MTFKHTKFEDSATMRSLTKLAQNKGWIKEDVVIKTASSSKLNLNPSNNLTENLLKLCNGLRAAGFEKQSEELELKFVNYKKAQSLYGVGNEAGEDLVHAAHPKGSHKLEDIDSKEAVFEDILDKHTQFLNVVNNKPTGKLASSKSIINAVKIALAANMSDIKDAMQKVSDYTNKIITIAGQGGGLTDMVLNWGKGRADIIKNIANQNIFTLNNVTSSEDALNSLERNFHPNALHNWLPDLLNKGISSDEVWDKLSGYFGAAHQQINVAKEMMKSIALEGESTPTRVTPNADLQMKEVEVQADPLIGKGTDLINALKAYQSIGTVAKNPAAITWIKNQIKEIQDVMERYQKSQETGQGNQVKSSLEEEMNTKEIEIKDFYSKAVKPRSVV